MQMKTILKFILIVTVSSIIYSCSSTRVFVKPNTEFTKELSLTISDFKNDRAGIVGELQYQLVSNGYNVISESVAKHAVNMVQEGTLKKDYFKSNTQVYRSAELKSLYVLNARGNWAYHPLVGYEITSLNCELVDLFTGEVVMTTSFRGGKNAKNVAKDFVEKLNEQISM
jgi:hypothetical protein